MSMTKQKLNEQKKYKIDKTKKEMNYIERDIVRHKIFWEDRNVSESIRHAFAIVSLRTSKININE